MALTALGDYQFNAKKNSDKCVLRMASRIAIRFGYFARGWSGIKQAICRTASMLFIGPGERREYCGEGGKSQFPPIKG
jgi:hypothetical protein